MSKKKKPSHAPTVKDEHPVEETVVLGRPAEEPEVRIPEAVAPAPEAGSATRRFIRTGEAPHVSVRGEIAENEDASAVTKFTDRLAAEAPEERVHTGFTGKMGTYDEVHKTEESPTRMIRPDLAEQLSFDDVAAEAVFEDAPADETKPVDRGDLLRQIAGTADEDVRRNPDQLMMEGFDTIGMKTEEEVRKEEELAEELRSAREKKIGAFRFWGKKTEEETGQTQDKTLERASLTKALPDFTKKISSRFQHLETPFAPIPCDEYTDHMKRREGFTAILKAKRATLIKAAILAILGLVLLIINAVAKGGAAGNQGFIKIFGGNDTVFVALNLAVFLAAVALTRRELKNGVFSILKLHPRADASLLAMDFAVLLQTVLAFFTQLKVQSDFQLLAPGAVLLSAAYLLAEYFYREHTHQCFKSVSTKSDKSYLRTVSDPVLSVRLTGDPEGKKKAVYVGRTHFIHSFFEKSATAAAGASGYGRVIAVCFALAAVTGLLGWILGKSFLLGVTGAALVLAFAMPVSCLIATGFYLSGRNRSLSLKSSYVGSFEDAAALTRAENVAADAAEIFDVKLKNVLTTKGVSEKQARYVAASILNKSDSLLKKAFRADIESFDDKLPPAESLQYEEKLGLSAWVGGCKVLFGNYDLLSNHSVSVPNANAIAAALGETERAVYLSIEGRFAAVFTVEYHCREELRRGAKSLVEGGSALVLSTADANISDAFAETLLGLPKESVRVMNRAAAEELAAAKAIVTDAEDPGVVFSDGFTGLCRVADAAATLEKIRNVSSLIGAAGALVAAVLGLILVVTGAYKGISAISVFLFQLVFTALCFISPLLTSVEPALTGTMKKLGRKKEKPEDTEKTAAEDAAPETHDAPEAQAAPEETAEAPETEAPAPVPEETPAPAPETAPAAPPEEETAPAKDPADYDDEDFSLFGEARREKKKRPEKQRKGRKGAPEAQPEEAHEAEKAPEEEPSKLITSASMRSTFSAIDAFLDDLTAGETAPEEERDDGFSLFGESGEGQRTAEDIEASYERRKREERDVRDAFTAPAAPAAPVFDLYDEPEEEAEETPETPAYGEEAVDLFDDDLWSRFEDDKVFAGLHETEDDDASDFNF